MGSLLVSILQTLSSLSKDFHYTRSILYLTYSESGSAGGWGYADAASRLICAVAAAAGESSPGSTISFISGSEGRRPDSSLDHTCMSKQNRMQG